MEGPNLIREESRPVSVESFETTPIGWMSYSRLFKTLFPKGFKPSGYVSTFSSDSGEYSTEYKGGASVPYYDIKEFAKGYKETHPEYFKVYKTKGGNAEHFSPEFIKIICKHFRKRLPQEVREALN